MKLGRLFAIAMLALGFFAITGFGTKSKNAQNDSASPQHSPSFDVKMLRREFRLAQGNEMKLFEQREQKAAQEFRASQNARQKEFDTSEREARRKYFADVHDGPDKRTYMKALIERREKLRAQLSDEKKQFQSDAENRLETLVDDQHRKRAQFDESIKRGERPADSVWPQPAKSEVTTAPSPR